MRLCAATIMAIILLASAPGSAWAQAGYYLIPSFSLTESYDDNIFGSPSNTESDFISRFSPGVQAGYRSEPFTLLFNGGFDAEVFAKHPEENNAVSGWHVGVSSTYLPIRVLTLGFGLSYSETRSLPTLTEQLTQLALANPKQPQPANTLQSGRLRNTVLTASPSVGYAFDPRTNASAAYVFTYSAQEKGATNTGHQVPLSLSRQLTQLDTGSINYRLDVFESSDADTTISHAVTLGWTRPLTPRTTISLSGGPRFTQGDGVAPEVSASLSHQFKLFEQQGQASIAYAYSEGFVLGQAGATKTETLTGAVSFQPLRSLSVNLGASAARFFGGTGPDTTTYGVTAGVSYQILKWLGAHASYSYTLEDQDVGGNIYHNVFSIGLDASYPIRIDQ